MVQRHAAQSQQERVNQTSGLSFSRIQVLSPRPLPGLGAYQAAVRLWVRGWGVGVRLSGGFPSPPLCASSSQRPSQRLERAVPLFRREGPGSQRFQGGIQALALGQSASASGALSLQPACSFFLSFPIFYVPAQTAQGEEGFRNVFLMASTGHKPWVFMSAGLRVSSRDANGGLHH